MGVTLSGRKGGGRPAPDPQAQAWALARAAPVGKFASRLAKATSPLAKMSELAWREQHGLVQGVSRGGFQGGSAIGRCRAGVAAETGEVDAGAGREGCVSWTGLPRGAGRTLNWHVIGLNRQRRELSAEGCCALAPSAPQPVAVHPGPSANSPAGLRFLACRTRPLHVHHVTPPVHGMVHMPSSVRPRITPRPAWPPPRPPPARPRAGPW